MGIIAAMQYSRLPRRARKVDRAERAEPHNVVVEQSRAWGIECVLASTGSGRGMKPMLVVECAVCHSKYKSAWPAEASSERIAKPIRKLGWYLDRGRSPKCATCKKLSTNEEGKPVSAPKMMSIAPSVPNLKIAFAVYESLTANFDRKIGRYRENWSDAAIAKEIGTAESYVKSVREEHFPCELDPRVLQLRDDLELYRDELCDLGKKISDLNTREVEMMKRQAEMRERLSVLLA